MPCFARYIFACLRTLQNLAKDQKTKASGKLAAMKDEVGNVVNRDGTCEIAEKEATAEDFLEFLDDARGGKLISPDVIIRFAEYFKDELTLDQIPCTQRIVVKKWSCAKHAKNVA